LEESLRKVSNVQAVYNDNEDLKAAKQALEFEVATLKKYASEVQSKAEEERHSENRRYHSYGENL